MSCFELVILPDPHLAFMGENKRFRADEIWLVKKGDYNSNLTMIVF